MSDLTKRQKEVYLFIRRFICREQRPPTQSEIANEFGFKSNNSSVCHLKAIEKKGYIKVNWGGRRQIKVLGQTLAWI